MVFKFYGDRARAGVSGPAGPDGESAYQIAVANGFVGTEAQWLASLVGPAGQDGADGINGTNGSEATVSVGTTTTGLAGSNASVTNSGTSAAAVFNFTIPRGQDGINGTNGTNGSAATITVGTTTTGTPTTPASVTNVGTANAAVLNFIIPRGEQGVQGPSGITRRIVMLSGVTDASGNVAFTFSPAFSVTPHISPMIVTTNTRQFWRITAASATGCTVNCFQQNQTLLSLLGIDILTAGVTAIAGATVRVMATDMA